MITRRFAAFAAAMMTAFASVPLAASSEESEEEEKIYTVTFVDFDGNVMDTQKVHNASELDYKKIDTDSLHSHIDVYTEQTFYSWSSNPVNITEDITIYALYRRAVLSVDSLPSRTEYYGDKGNATLDGLKASITLYTQVPIKDSDGKFHVTEQVEDITGSCSAKPSKLEEIFAGGDASKISIYPPGDDKPIAEYDVTLFRGLGDLNSDKSVDSSDASNILVEFAELVNNSSYTISDERKKLCDVNRDEVVDSSDASLVLVHYTYSANGEDRSWEEIFEEYDIK